MDAAELEWIAWTTPITTSLGAALAASDFSGRTVACRQHILADTICIAAPFVEAGARARLAPCNLDSTDDRTVAHLTSPVEPSLVAGQAAAVVGGSATRVTSWVKRPKFWLASIGVEVRRVPGLAPASIARMSTGQPAKRNGARHDPATTTGWPTPTTSASPRARWSRSARPT